MYTSCFQAGLVVEESRPREACTPATICIGQVFRILADSQRSTKVEEAHIIQTKKSPQKERAKLGVFHASVDLDGCSV